MDKLKLLEKKYLEVGKTRFSKIRVTKGTGSFGEQLGLMEILSNPEPHLRPVTEMYLKELNSLTNFSEEEKESAAHRFAEKLVEHFNAALQRSTS